MPVKDEGGGVVSFDSMDEFFAWQSKKEDEANARIAPWQQQIKPGDYVWRVVEMGDQSLMILGETYTPVEHYDRMIREGYDPEECAYERDTIAESAGRGYLYGKWYSLIEPRGEYGSAHISVLGPRVDTATWRHWLEMIENGIDPLTYLKEKL